ncbi:MAG: hypothetical protein ACLR9W_03315 [Enterobacter hormaechei]
MKHERRINSPFFWVGSAKAVCRDNRVERGKVTFIRQRDDNINTMCAANRWRKKSDRLSRTRDEIYPYPYRLAGRRQDSAMPTNGRHGHASLTPSS